MAKLIGQGTQQVAKMAALCFRNEMLQAGPNGLGIFMIRFNQPQATEHAKRRFIQRNRMSIQTILKNPTYGVVIGGLIPGDLLGGLLEAFLVQRFQIKREGGFKDLL